MPGDIVRKVWHKNYAYFLTLKFIFIDPKISVSNRLRLLLIDIDEVFLIQSSEFTNLMYFGSNKKKLQQKDNPFFHLKIDFFR